MTAICPCCQQTMPASDALHWDAHTRLLVGPMGAWRMSPRQAAVFDCLWRRRNVPLTAMQIMDAVYGDDPSGGPESQNVVHVVLGVMRARLATFGLRVAAAGGRGSRGMMLIDAPAMDPAQ